MERSKRTTRRLVEGSFVVAVLGLVAMVTTLIVGDDAAAVATTDRTGDNVELGDFAVADAVTDPVVAAWVTSPNDASRRFAATPTSDETATRSVVVDLDDRRQRWSGVGAALTDSSVELLDGNDAALDLLFATGEGARLNLVRLPLSATDFSIDEWTWEIDATGRAVPGPTAVRALDLVDEIAIRTGDDLSVAAAAWTAPAEFADPVDAANPAGRALRAGSESRYGDFIVDQARWLVARGVPLRWLSLGNEPGHVADYPTMSMEDAQLAAIGREVAPRLDELDVDLLAVDHNWADRDRVDAVIAAAPGAFDAAAFHCYAGEPAQMADLPIPAIVTECTGTTDTWSSTFAWDARHLIQDSIEHGSTGLMMWNLALDQRHGPKRDWGCAECRGLVTIDPSTGAIETGPEFYALGHLARAATPGSTVVGAATTDDVPVAAFQHADGTVGVVGHNSTGEAQAIEIVATDGRTLTIAVGADELFTVTF